MEAAAVPSRTRPTRSPPDRVRGGRAPQEHDIAEHATRAEPLVLDQ
ncbi:hypothetical protein ACOBQX_04960 [Actinokineospora sp. G85]